MWIHHTVIRVEDMDRSIAYWRDGVGLDLLMDGDFEGDWPTLFNAPSNVLRSVFLGERGRDGGILELVDFGTPGRRQPPGEMTDLGLMLVAFQCAVDPVLSRLEALGFDAPLREVTVPSARGPVRIVLLEDPNGVRFELTEFLGAT
jgi:catechol 2,3-dioxygenase-like lactoylglutathione lyase family enzyme